MDSCGHLYNQHVHFVKDVIKVKTIVLIDNSNTFYNNSNIKMFYKKFLLIFLRFTIPNWKMLESTFGQ